MNFKNIMLSFFTIGIFTNLFYYLPHAKIIKIPEYIIYFTLLIVMLFIYLYKRQNLIFDKQIFYWVIFYFSLNLLYLNFTGIGSVEFRFMIPVIMIIPLFLALSLLYSLDDENLTITRKSIIYAFLISIPLIIFDFVSPGFFVNTKIEDARAVATYGNANIVGAVLIVGLILSIDIIPKKFRVIYILYIFMGILVTFSRSNIMLFLLILAVMSFQNKITKKLFFFIIIFIFSFFIFLLFDGQSFLEQNFGIVFNDNIVQRLAFFIGDSGAKSYGMSERQQVLNAALNMFYESPFYGNGFASTRLWNYHVGPHNTIALTLAEFGVFGFLIVPLLLFVSTYKIFISKNKELKQIAFSFVIYYLYSCMFSHNMLEQTFNYASIVILSILGLKEINKEVLYEKI